MNSARSASPKVIPLTVPVRLPNKDWFSLREAGSVLGLSESFIEKLYDQGELTGHSHNAGKGERQHKRILRISLVAYIIRSADYSEESLDDQLLSALLRLPPEKILRLTDQARTLAGA